MKLERIYILRRRDKRRPGYAASVPRVFAVFTVTAGRRWGKNRRLYRGSLWVENGTDGRDYVTNQYEDEGDYSMLALLRGSVENAVASLGDEADAALKKKILQIGQDVLTAEGCFESVLSKAGYFPQRIK